MTTWTQQLTGIPGNYDIVLGVLTFDDGECLQAFYNLIQEHTSITGKTLENYVNEGICISVQQDGGIINPSSIATLRSVGLILTSDNVHIGLTALGLGFMQSMLALV